MLHSNKNTGATKKLHLIPWKCNYKNGKETQQRHQRFIVAVNVKSDLKRCRTRKKQKVAWDLWSKQMCFPNCVLNCLSYSLASGSHARECLLLINIPIREGVFRILHVTKIPNTAFECWQHHLAFNFPSEGICTVWGHWGAEIFLLAQEEGKKRNRLPLRLPLDPSLSAHLSST